jgi:Transketolase, N-terminal subunit
MLSEPDLVAQLRGAAAEIRALTLRMMNAIGSGHVGGAMSVVDALTLLYFFRMRIRPEDPGWPDRDRLVLSKGHAGPALYAALAVRGYFPAEDCLTLNRPGTRFPSHCDMRKTPGVDMTAGSLGQGLSAAVGMALAGRLDGKGYKTYCIIGDGEAQEGQIWEALMYGAQQKLENLVVLLDYNRMQIDGTVDEINSLEPVAERFAAFRYFVRRVDGHDFAAMDAALDEAERAAQPSVIILDTVKGRGAPFAEGQVTSHHMPVTDEGLADALSALAVTGRE